MAIWKEIRKAINSTLGTSEFQSLDKIILSQKGLKASQNFYALAWKGDLSGTRDEPIDTGEIIEFNWGGTVIFGVKGYTVSETSGRIQILVNGETQGIVALPVSNSYKADYEYTEPISIKKGDRISVVSFSSSYTALNLNEVSIFADVEDVSGVTILKE